MALRDSAGAEPGSARRRAGASALAISLAGFYWIGHAFLVDAETFGWLLPFAVIGVPGISRPLHRHWFLRGRALLWRRGALRILAFADCAHRRRMAPRPRAHRVSLECLRLCAHEAAGACASRLAFRDLGTDLHRGRQSLRALRRLTDDRCRYQAAVVAVGLRADCSRRAGIVRIMAIVADADRLWSRASRCGSCSRTCSRTANSIIRPRRR